MTKILWDKTGERRYETGVDHGVLYLPNTVGVYDSGFAWNGLTTVTESPSGAESNKQYADNRVYVNLRSAELFGATIEALTYPDEFAQCDGSAEPISGIAVGQQARSSFGLCYRTKVGNDLDSEAGYKLHLVYGCTAAPSEKAYGTINDSPEAMGFSWELDTIPVDVTGTNPLTSRPYGPTALLVIDSTKVDADTLSDLEDRLYGTGGTDPDLPSPNEIITMFSGSVTVATPTMPTFVSGTHTITIPTVTGVDYLINDVVQAAGAVVIAVSTVVTARPKPGYKFPPVTDDDWLYVYV